jgi:hypothetical protein
VLSSLFAHTLMQLPLAPYRRSASLLSQLSTQPRQAQHQLDILPCHHSPRPPHASLPALLCRQLGSRSTTPPIPLLGLELRRFNSPVLLPLSPRRDSSSPEVLRWLCSFEHSSKETQSSLLCFVFYPTLFITLHSAAAIISVPLTFYKLRNVVNLRRVRL